MLGRCAFSDHAEHKLRVLRPIDEAERYEPLERFLPGRECSPHRGRETLRLDRIELVL